MAQKLWLADLTQPLINHSQLVDKKLDIFLIHDDTVNAFAAPGRIIGVHSGLILKVQDVEELSAVLAHEIAHISQRHYAHRRASQEQSSPAYIAALIASVLLASNVDADLGYAGIHATITASTHQTMAYSRAHEQEADRIGIELMQASGLNTKKMLRMLAYLDSPLVKHDPKWLWARSHPIATERIADLTLRTPNEHVQGSFPPQYQTDFILIKLLLRSQLLDPTKTNIETITDELDIANNNYELYKTFAQGLIAEYQHQWQQAQTIFARLSRKHPNNTLIWHRWMHSLQQGQRYQDVVTEAKQRIDMAVSTDMANYYLATSYAASNNMPQALLYLRKLLAAQPLWASGWALMADWTAQSEQLIEHRLAKSQWHLLRTELDAAQQQLLLIQGTEELSNEQTRLVKQITQQINNIKNLAL